MPVPASTPTPRVILFAGAPAPISVDSESCTLDSFDETFQQFFGRLDSKQQKQKHTSPASGAEAASQSPPHAVWRSVPLNRRPLQTGLSQNHSILSGSFHAHRDFFTTVYAFSGDEPQSFSGGEDGGAILTQFCEESLAAHTLMPSSQIGSFSIGNTEDTTTSFMTNDTDDISLQDPTNPLTPPVPLHLSDLEDVPSAARILALSPQTVTLNLIVAVISIAQPRTVTTRWGTTLSLVEVLVGDETKSGFAVTFWLSNDQAATGQISKLRRQDVVLMENVALHVFRGKVYGQSLRKNLTRVNLLWRSEGGGYYQNRDLARRAAAKHPQQEKTRLVKDWVLHFVGRDSGAATRKRTGRLSWDQPPDDTQ
ncbi:uncharacterized protein TrAFT101_002594 [Trichoderma asperellum]|uniref:Telomeric single stranded DNA binding POT1/Cdc13 domain-containing protein n=1 Tax=Trichoderma asperellum (strain ATCC 204424 / CBS 433.97 / NBRC 101777) TaxID=1042311 RepID=A0A2T3ZGV7_TRIA4|nr:hypothetical protein M441DRAFT_340146 [Trichoderma asperellum CBS 433.97]PTB44036.1 hypothetical protein M441DRAFT_340146 [Trichoderma asperellum CBS 433.97]UKZ86769.1 hypothetical protein TrAFT101_002594 [Trichoderma asperellum]